MSAHVPRVIPGIFPDSHDLEAPSILHSNPADPNNRLVGHGLAVDLCRGTGTACQSKWACTLCGACPRNEMHLVFNRAALQMLRGDLPTLCFRVYIACDSSGGRKMALISRYVHNAMGMIQAGEVQLDWGMCWMSSQSHWLEQMQSPFLSRNCQIRCLGLVWSSVENPHCMCMSMLRSVSLLLVWTVRAA